MTLLEVMVALAIFALAGIAVMSSVSQQLVGLTALEEKTLATWVADNRLVEIKLRKSWPGLTWINGKEEMAGQTWYWRWQGQLPADRRCDPTQCGQRGIPRPTGRHPHKPCVQ